MPSKILTAAPDVTVLVPTWYPTAGWECTSVNTFGNAPPRLVEDRRAESRRVGLVRFGTLDNGDLVDGLHLTDSGYAKTATVFYGGLARAATDSWITENVSVPPTPGGISYDRDADVNADGRADYLVIGANSTVRCGRSRARELA
ncbi:hypothetical protein [Streptomyces albipurpureus]|uniref:Uncharacterized protein n=1 Tax=Streptomyces albipurpureus TaxID=2897419 RepID=A0ABT0UJP6_9ACTN|nr:hypothetical protein [Streptomyces sp. CWNU-1]MCM2388325.1 hypothetical protein [Streptomyces sp. CWNU-1]